MRRPSCGFENPEGLKFCNECGAPFRMPCAQCGFANQPQAKFCGECGTPLTAQSPPPPAAFPSSPLQYTPGYLAEKILTSKAALEGERKQVTILFADLKGSMELLADRDPEDSRQLLDPVLERMMAAVHGYRGTVNQGMGVGHLSLGEAQMIAGRLEKAHALAERALDLAREHQERGNPAYTLRLLGDIAARRDPPEGESAVAHYQQALALAEELGMRPLQAHCRRGLGMVYARLGRLEQASTELSSAIALYRGMEMTFWLPQTEMTLAQVEGR